MEEVARHSMRSMARWGRICGWLEERGPVTVALLAWGLCLLPRIVAVLALPHSMDYEAFASGRRFSFWYPLYTTLASTAWALTSGRLGLYMALHVAVHALIGPAGYALVRGLRLPRMIAWLSVLGVALHPYFVSMAPRQPENGFTVFLFTGYLVAFVWWVRNDFTWKWGLFHALSAFLLFAQRPNGLVVIALLFGLGCLVAWRCRKFSGLVRVVGSWIALTAFVATLAAFNVWRTGSPSTAQPNYGYNLYIGNNPFVPEYARRYDIQSFEELVWDRGLPGSSPTWLGTREQERELANITLEWMRRHRMQTVENALWKTLRYWDIRLFNMDEKPFMWNFIYGITYVVYLPLSLVGLWMLVRRRWYFAAAVLGLTPFVYWLPHVVFFGTIRMRMVTEPLLLMLAAYAVGTWIMPWWKRRVLHNPSFK